MRSTGFLHDLLAQRTEISWPGRHLHAATQPRACVFEKISDHLVHRSDAAFGDVQYATACLGSLPVSALQVNAIAERCERTTKIMSEHCQERVAGFVDLG